MKGKPTRYLIPLIFTAIFIFGLTGIAFACSSGCDYSTCPCWSYDECWPFNCQGSTGGCSTGCDYSTCPCWYYDECWPLNCQSPTTYCYRGCDYATCPCSYVDQCTTSCYSGCDYYNTCCPCTTRGACGQQSCDQYNPVVTIDSPADGTWYAGSTQVGINASATDIGSGVNEVEIYVDGALANASYSSSCSYTWMTPSTGTGPHTIAAVAYDGVGRTDTKTITVNVDNSPPGIPGAPDGGGQYTWDTSIQWDWAASTDTGSGVSGYEVYIVESPGGTVIDNWAFVSGTSYTHTGEDGKTYTCSVRAKDNVGNRSFPVTGADVTVDLTNPTVSSVSAPAYDRGTLFASAVATDPDPPGGYASGIHFVGFNCNTIPSIDYTSPYDGSWDTSTWTDGPYTIYVWAWDMTGHSNSAAATTTVIVDNTPPSTPGTPSAQIIYTNTTDIIWRWDESLEDNFDYYEVDVGTTPWGWDVVDGATTSATLFLHTGVNGQTYYATVRAHDKAGNTSAWTANGIVAVMPSPFLAIKNYWHYIKEDMGQGGTAAVNVANGNLVVTVTDIEIPGPGLVLKVTRTYNSRTESASFYPYGYGWDINLNTRIIEESDGSLTQTGGDGSKSTFVWEPGGTYKRPNGVFSTITKNADGTYQVKDKDQVRYNYDTGSNGGRLKSIVDRYGNTITLEYDASGRISIVKDNAIPERCLAFGYDAAGKLSTITDPLGRVISYTYDGDYLKTATDFGNHKTTYGYSSNLLITVTISDAQGNNGATTQFEYEYDRVARIFDAVEMQKPPQDRKKTAFSYDEPSYETLVTDQRGYTSTYYFDTGGRCTTIIDQFGKMTGYEYNDDHLVISHTDQRGVVSKYEYDTWGNLVRSIKDHGQGKLNITREYGYDQYNNPIWSKDANGNITDYRWSADGKWLNSIEYPLVLSEDGINYVRPKVEYTYYPNGRRESETQLIGLTQTSYTKWEYDAYGYGNVTYIRTKICDTGEQAVTEYRYDYGPSGFGKIGLAYEMVDPRGYPTRYVYDAEGKLIRETRDADGDRQITVQDLAWREYTYDHLHNKLTERWQADDANTYTITYTYDAKRRIDTVSYPDGGFTDYTYDAAGNKTAELVKINDVENVTTTYAYDALNRLNEIHYPDGGIVTYQYDEVGNKRFEEIKMDARVQKTEYVYDSLSRNIQVKKAITDPAVLVLASEFTYDNNGNKLTEKDIRGIQTSYAYDALNRLIQEIRAEGTPSQAVITHYYYRNGLKRKDVDPNGNSIEYEYYPDGRLKKENRPDGGYTEYEYDVSRNKTKETGRVTDAQVRSTQYSYNSRNLLSTVTDPDNNSWAYEYDYVGNLIKARCQKTASPSWTYEYTYDSQGRLKTAKDQVGETVTNTYDYVGNLKSVLDRNGVTTTYAYDKMKRPTGISAPGINISYVYDYAGNRTSMTDSTGVTSYQYDLLNRLTRVDYPGGRTITYEYDDLNNYKWITDPYNGPSNRAKLAFDELNRLKVVTDPDGRTATYAYDPGGRRASLTLSTGQATTYEYYSTNDLKKLVNKDTQGSVVSSYEYTYYYDGNLKTKTESSGITAYTYDNVGRLSTITEPDGVVTTYQYDAVGNRVDMIKTGVGTTQYTYDLRERLVSITLPSGGVRTLSYDNNGNQVSTTQGGITTTYTYDALNRLTGMTKPGVDVTYAYDGDGKRVSKTLNGTRTQYLYEGDDLIFELDGAGNYDVEYIHGINLVGVKRIKEGIGYLSYLYNGHGDVTGVLGSDGLSIKNSYEYDPFGNLKVNNETVPNDYLYCGEGVDDETGYYLLGARYYSPEVGRFVTEDTYMGTPDDPLSLNLYAYAYNNPLTLCDPTGHFSEPIENVLTDFGLDPEDLPKWLDDILSGGLGFIPLVGDLADILTFFIGIDPVTGDKASSLGRVFSGIAVFLPCISGSQVSLATKFITKYFDDTPVGNLALKLLPKADEVVDVGEVVEKGAEATGELHHLLSNKIMKALVENPSLKGKFLRNDPDFIYRATDKMAHRGYQRWHRAVDNEIVVWIRNHPYATGQEFKNFLNSLYRRLEVARYIPNVNIK